MNVKMKTMCVTMLMVVCSAGAHAGADCKKAPKSQWMHVLDMQKKIVNEYGFAIKRFLESGNCYEIYGWGLNDKKTDFVKIEVYFDPVTGEIVKKKVK